ncbi:MAG: heavy metal translocating P-type ATPase, partial [Pararhodobacter sp.]
MTPAHDRSLQLNIPVLLPDAPDAADACSGRLVAGLTGREGVTRVHLLAAAGDQPAKLCIHYDPETLSLARIKEIAEGVGAEITRQFGHVLWQLEGITSARRARTLTDHLLKQPGVQEASVSAGGAVRIEFDRTLTSASALQGALDDIRQRPEDGSAHDHDEAAKGHHHGGFPGDKTELIFSAISGVLLLLGVALPFVTTPAGWLPLSLFIAAYAFGGFFLLREAIDNLRLRRL